MIKEEGKLAFELEDKVLADIIGIIELLVQLFIGVLNFNCELIVMGVVFFCGHE
jgi:hypothetical protein